MSVRTHTTSGPIEGVADGDVVAFKGIPYAQPPVGELRFRPPQPAVAWVDRRLTTAFGPCAIQAPMHGTIGELGTPNQPQGDDCLNLNVWTPDPQGAGMPVLVWIHGGAFYGGSGGEDFYSGASFARHGVVTVSFNYRLGAMGFLHLDDHFPELAGAGNAGVLDMIAALEWVRDNIDRFGGDPDRVTIAGESAGGMAVGTLMATPRARPLFQRAICQSGAASNGISASTASMIAGHLLEAVGVEPGDLEALAAVPSQTIVNAQEALGVELNETRNPEKFGEAAASAMAFQPTYGTDLIPEFPLDAIAAGAAGDIALLVGTTRDEAQIFLVDLKDMFSEEVVAGTIDAVMGAAGKDGSEALACYRATRQDREFYEIGAAFETDRMFTIPAVRMADAQSRHNADVWRYRFDWANPTRGGSFGAHHFLDVPFMFGELDNAMVDGLLEGSAPDVLVDQTHRAWVNFVTHGDPNHNGLPAWPRYTAATQQTMLLDDPSTVVGAPSADELALWAGVI